MELILPPFSPIAETQMSGEEDAEMVSKAIPRELCVWAWISRTQVGEW